MWSADAGRVDAGAGAAARGGARRAVRKCPCPRRLASRRADAGSEPARRRRRQAPLADDSTSLFEPTLEHVSALGPIEQRRGRPGALAAIPGSSRRPAVHRRAPAARDARVERHGRRRQSRLARSALLRHLRTDRPLQGQWTLGSDPAVLQRRHPDAVHAAGRGRARAGRRAHKPSGQNLNAYVPISPQFDLRERRDIGTVRVERDADDTARRDRRFHDDEALGRAAVGRQLRVQQRQRGGAAVQVPHQRPGRRCPVDERAVDDSRRLQRFVVQQPWTTR